MTCLKRDPPGGAAVPFLSHIGEAVLLLVPTLLGCVGDSNDFGLDGVVDFVESLFLTSASSWA